MKKLVLFLSAMFVFPLASGALTDFSVEKPFDESFYGGEEQTASIIFENNESSDAEFRAFMNISSDLEMSGEEFDVKMLLRSENSSEVFEEELDCISSLKDNYTLGYNCSSSSISDSSNELFIGAKSHPAIMPGKYNLSLQIYSVSDGSTVEVFSTGGGGDPYEPPANITIQQNEPSNEENSINESGDSSDTDQRPDQNFNENESEQESTNTSDNEGTDQNQGGALGQGPTGQFVADNGSSLGLVILLLMLGGAAYWKKEELTNLLRTGNLQFP